MVEGFAGEVAPGTTVPAPGVGFAGGGVPLNRVEVGRARKVGVGGAWVAGAAHAVSTAAKMIKPIKKAKCILMFIVISSLTAWLTKGLLAIIISLEKKKNARIVLPGVVFRLNEIYASPKATTIIC
jgi:hypothetical protein